MNLSKLTKTFKNFHLAVRLYLSYLVVSLVIWCVNKSALGTQVAESIGEFSSTFEPVITYRSSFSLIFLKSFAITLAVYIVILVIQGILNRKIGGVLYLVLAVLVGLAAGTGFGGGLFSYLWGNSWLIILLGQIEWLGGALLVSSVPSFKDLKKKESFLGVLLIALAAFGGAWVLFATPRMILM